MATNTDLYLPEYGQNKRVLIETGYNLSSATVVLVIFSASAGAVTATCSVLAANYTTSAGVVLSANKVAEFVPTSGLFSATGADTYAAWIDATFSGTRLVSDSFKFVVSNPGD